MNGNKGRDFEPKNVSFLKLLLYLLLPFFLPSLVDSLRFPTDKSLMANTYNW